MRPSASTSRSLVAALVAAAAVHAEPAFAQVGVDLELQPPAPTPGASFGASVAVDGGVAVVGAPHGNGLVVDSGVVHLFGAATGSWTNDLAANDGASGDGFGFSVAISDGVVVVGAHFDDDNGPNSGSAYLFDAATGAQLGKLLPSDGAAGDEFGFAVAVGDGVIAIGANRDDDHGPDSGSVYLFDALTGSQFAKLTAHDAGPIANFGEALDIDDGILVVGAHGDDEKGRLAGAAYLFDVNSGTELSKLLAADGGSNDFLGAAVAIDDGTVVVGAWADSIVSDHSGSAYLFDASSGAQIAKLVPNDSDVRDHFGNAVAIDRGIVVIGAELDDDTTFNAGSAYFFRHDGVELGEILASDGASNDEFGYSVAIEGDVVIAGAHRHDQFGNEAGTAYVVDSPFGYSAEVVRVGSPANPIALLPGTTTGPVVASVWDPIVDHTSFVPNAVVDVLLVSLVPGPINVATPPHGTLLCDLASFTYTLSIPGSPFGLSIPGNQSLVGVELCTQAVSMDSLGALHLTNALDVIIGSF